MLYLEKSCRTTLFRKQTEISQSTSTFISIGHSLRNNGSLKIWKICVFLRFIFQNKSCWHFEFLLNQISGQKSIIFAKFKYRGQLLLKLRAVEVANFTEYRPDQLINKHTKIVLNPTIQLLEGRFQKKQLLKVWNFLFHATTK